MPSAETERRLEHLDATVSSTIRDRLSLPALSSNPCLELVAFPGRDESRRPSRRDGRPRAASAGRSMSSAPCSRIWTRPLATPEVRSATATLTAAGRLGVLRLEGKKLRGCLVDLELGCFLRRLVTGEVDGLVGQRVASIVCDGERRRSVLTPSTSSPGAFSCRLRRRRRYSHVRRRWSTPGSSPRPVAPHPGKVRLIHAAETQTHWRHAATASDLALLRSELSGAVLSTSTSVVPMSESAAGTPAPEIARALTTFRPSGRSVDRESGYRDPTALAVLPGVRPVSR